MKQKAHNSIDIANYLLSLSRKENKTLTPMQLIKLAYISHGWMWGLYDKPLINEGEIKAWQYGPVIPELYESIKHHRRNPVQYPVIPSIVEAFSEIEQIDQYKQEIEQKFNNPDTNSIFCTEEKDVMTQVFNAYNGYTGEMLSNITHKPNTPWSKTWNNGKYQTIPETEIKEYYKKLLGAKNE